MPFLRQPNPHQLPVQTESRQPVAATLSLTLPTWWDMRATWVFCRKAQPHLTYCTCRLCNQVRAVASEYLKLLGSTWMRFLKIFRGWGVGGRCVCVWKKTQL